MDEEEAETIEFQPFTSPCLCLVIGATNSGKTYTTGKIIENFERLFSQKLDRLVVFTNAYNQEFVRHLSKDLPPTVEVVARYGNLKTEHLQVEKLKPRGEGTQSAVILDDHLSSFISAGEELRNRLRDLFLVNVHHNKINVFVLIQSSSFLKSDVLNVLFQNANTFVLTFHKAIVSTQMLLALQRQVYPGGWVGVCELYKVTH
jgi:hypothetical protein